MPESTERALRDRITLLEEHRKSSEQIIAGLREHIGALAGERNRANATIEELSDRLRLDGSTEAEIEELRASVDRAAALAKAERRVRTLERLVGTLGRTLRTVTDSMGRAISELSDDIPF